MADDYEGLTTNLVSGYHLNNDVTDWYSTNDATNDGATGCENQNAEANRAMQFDGSNDEITGFPALTNQSDFSISMWIYNVSFTSADRILHFGLVGSDTEPHVDWHQLTGDNRVTFRIRDSDGDYEDISHNMNTGQWYHCVQTYDQSAGEMKVYVDNVLIDTKTGVSVTSNWAGTAFSIGSQGTKYFGNVRLDELRIYDSVLSSSDVSTLYNNFVPPAGWTGKIGGVSNPSKINGISVSGISKVNGV